MDISEIRKKAKKKDGGEAASATPKSEPKAPQEPPKSVSKPSEEAEVDALFKGMEQGEDAKAAASTVPDAAAVTQATESVQPAIETKAEAEPAIETAGAATEGERVEAITFRLNNEEYALDINRVKEVIKARELTSVPRAPGAVLGVISLRGVIVPVVDLRKILCLPAGGAGERILIAKDEDELVGFLVDSVSQVVRVSADELESTPTLNTIDADLIRAIGRHGGRPFILLETDKVMARI